MGLLSQSQCLGGVARGCYAACPVLEVPSKSQEVGSTQRDLAPFVVAFHFGLSEERLLVEGVSECLHESGIDGIQHR